MAFYQWIPDETVSNCLDCNSLFTFFNRKHHCRFCGGVFCAECISYRANIPNVFLADNNMKMKTRAEYKEVYANHNESRSQQKVCFWCKKEINLLEAQTTEY